MSEVEVLKAWREELASLVEDAGNRYAAEEIRTPSPPPVGIGRSEFGFSAAAGGGGELPESEPESLKDQVNGFLKAWGEMLLELGRGCKDIIVQQNIVTEDSFIVQKIGAPCAKVSGRLRVLNEFLPEDRDPAHAWPVVFFVFILALAVLNVNTKYDGSVTPVKKVYIHPPSATRILLPDGRRMAYHEFGVPADRARFSLIAPHSFLSSRLAGIPGVKASLLEEFGVRLVTYDLPGFGESDPHPSRNLNSSALDMLFLADTVGIIDKFWVLGYSSASTHAWAAMRYIPSRIAGAAMFAPLVNPYEPTMSKEERSRTWGNWVSKRKLMYILARRFPKLLSYFYRKTFLSGKHGQIDKWLSLSLREKDQDLIEEPKVEEFWHRDVEESIRQGTPKPFMEEAMLQVSDWGFNLADLQVQRKCQRKGILSWLWSIYSQADCELSGFLGPIHIWQGMDDMVIPPSMTDYIGRVLPAAFLHKLPNEGHFSYFFFCDECHKQIFSTLFGTPQGPHLTMEFDKTSFKGDLEEALSHTDSNTK